jgi:hypothetical protein
MSYLFQFKQLQFSDCSTSGRYWDELKLLRLLHREISGLHAFQDFVNPARSLTIAERK